MGSNSKVPMKANMKGRKLNDVKSTKKEVPLATKKNTAEKAGHGTGRKR